MSETSEADYQWNREARKDHNAQVQAARYFREALAQSSVADIAQAVQECSGSERGQIDTALRTDDRARVGDLVCRAVHKILRQQAIDKASDEANEE